MNAASLDCPTCHGASTVDPDPDCPTCHGEGEVAPGVKPRYEGQFWLAWLGTGERVMSAGDGTGAAIIVSADGSERRVNIGDDIEIAQPDDFTKLRLLTDRTLAFTWGRWGGFYRKGGPDFWRVCVGWIAVTFIRDEFTSVLRAYLDRLDEVNGR